MNLRKLYYLMLIIPMLFVYTGCSDDETTNPPVTVNEAEVLTKYIVDNDNPLENHTSLTMIKASGVYANINAGADQVILDIRSQEKWDAGHIKGSVFVDQKEVLAYYEANGLKDRESVVIACYTGQTAGWATSLMHMMGYTNVKDLKWGMCSWNELTADKWKSNIKNGYPLVDTPTQKPEKGDLPTLNTGKTTGAEILRVRVEEVFAEGFGAAMVSNTSISNHFIANYWNETDYSWGHVDGAMQYSPKAAFTLDGDLETLPTDQTIAVYCYTGQTSALVAAYLRVLGYDAQSVLYGVNAMSYDTMPGTKFNNDPADPDYSVHDYDLEQ